MLEKMLSLVLRQRFLVFLLVLGVVVAGSIAFRTLPIDAFPDISPNLVQVFAEIEGMAPEEVEQLVTRPVETTMRSTPGVKRIRSLSSLGLSTVNIYFEDDVDIYRARQMVTERLALAEEGIPKGVYMPHGLEMGPVASGMGKILAYRLQADGQDIADVRTMHEWLVKRDIEAVPGVAKVVSQGGYVREYQITLKPDQLVAVDLTVEDVAEAVRRNNTNVGAGIVTRGSEELIVRSMGRLKTIEDIEQTVVDTENGRPILVKDVATVAFGKAFRRGVATINGEDEIVCGLVYKLYGANSFEVIGRLKDRIKEINAGLPENVKVVPYYDQSQLVRSSIQTVRKALVMGLVLVCLVAFLFLGNVRNGLIVAGSLPFSVLLGLILMRVYGIPGDLISLGGVAIALGMLVDATIIMVEKIQTVFQSEDAPTNTTEGILSAAREVGVPILFGVVIIVTVFLPIFTLGEIEGKMFRPLAFTVTTTMFGSLIYALLVAPALCHLLRRRPGSAAKKAGHNRVLTAILDAYEAVLRPVLRHPVLVSCLLLLLLAAGGRTFFALGRQFIPTMREGTLQCTVNMNPNIALEEVKRACTDISQTLKTFPEVIDVVADMGFGEVGPHVHHTNYGCMTVTLAPSDTWTTAKTQDELVVAMTKRLDGYLGATVGFTQPINHELDGLIAGVGATVAAKIFGPSIEELKTISGQVEQVLKGMDGVADLRIEQVSGQSQVQVELDSMALARYGLNKDGVHATIHHAINGEVLGDVFEGEKAFRILLRFPDDYRSNVDSIGGLLIRTPAGAHVPLRDLARINTVTGIRQITREDTRRYLSVQCNVRGRDEGSFVAEAQQAVAKAVNLPPGYRVVWGGQFELQQAANRRLGIVIPVTLLLVMCMLYALFNSVKNVFLVLLNVPLALTGGIFALAYFGENLSVPSSVGFIALFGIALTNSVVLVSQFVQLQTEGMGLQESVIRGCRSRLRAVLMTAVTTYAGLLPLVIATGVGSEVQRPLAIVVLGGLVSSTLLTLLAVPTLYVWMSNEEAVDIRVLPYESGLPALAEDA